MSFPYRAIFRLEKDSVVLCPFNPQHKVFQSSLQRHVIRCKLKHPEFRPCPYNALHYFRTAELLAAHLTVCDSKPYPQQTDSLFRNEAIYSEDLTKVRNYNLEDENWDD